jgi:hypothetical protein
MVDRQKYSTLLYIIIFYLAAGVGFSVCLIDLYKARTYIYHQCQVKSVKVDWTGKNFKQKWEASVVVDDERKDIIVEKSISTRFEPEAWKDAQKHQVSFNLST